MQDLIYNTGVIPVAAETYKEYLGGVDWVLTSEVVIAGIIIVMLVLILLILIFKGFGKVVSKNQKPSQNTVSAPAPVQAVPAAAPAAPAVQGGVSADIVAAIATAIYTAEGGRQVTIRSIKVKNVQGRNPWAAAAIAENTKPF